MCNFFHCGVQEGKKKDVSFQTAIRLQCSGSSVSRDNQGCCASQKFVPSIQNNSKERFLAVGTA